MKVMVNPPTVEIVETKRSDGKPLNYKLDRTHDIHRNVGRFCNIRSDLYKPAAREPDRSWRVISTTENRVKYTVVNVHTGRVLDVLFNQIYDLY